jgi:hypothetical protein
MYIHHPKKEEDEEEEGDAQKTKTKINFGQRLEASHVKYFTVITT